MPIVRHTPGPQRASTAHHSHLRSPRASSAAVAAAVKKAQRQRSPAQHTQHHPTLAGRRMLQPAAAAVAAAASISSAASAARSTQQLPGSVRLLQVLSGALRQHVRCVAAQPARQMEQQPQPSAAASATAAATNGVRGADATATATAAAAAVAAADMKLQMMLQQPLQQQQKQEQHHQQQQQQPPSPTGVKKTFYKRKLPCPPATEFSSAEGRLLFAQALQEGTMTGFFKLVEQYSTQDEPAFCGLASIAMVLNALSIDPKRPWKGNWRWFHEELLDCCLPLDRVAQEGVVLTQAACLAKCNGANVALHRSGTFSLEQFRQAVIDTCSSGEEHLVVSYTRKAFGQTGDGHFSPVGGYHGARDLVLILDTARFKYPPHWVPLPMLYQAMHAVDPTTGQPRGFLRLSANARPDSVLFTLDIRPDGSWRQAEAFIQTTAPQLVQAAAASGQASPEALLQQLVALAPLESVPSFIAMRFAAHSCARDRCVPHTVRTQVLRELKATPLHQALQPLLAQHLAQQPQQQPAEQQQQPDDATASEQEAYLSEKLTVLLLLQEPSAWGAADAWADPQQHQAWMQLLDASAVSILDGEILYLRQQLHHLEDLGVAAAADGTGDDGGCSSCLGHAHVGAAAGAGVGVMTPQAVAVTAGAAGQRGVSTLAAAAGSSCGTCTLQQGCRSHGCSAKAGHQQGQVVSTTCGSDGGGCCGAGENERQDQQHGCCS